MNRQHLFFYVKLVYERIPTAAIREPLLSSTEKSPATMVETNEEILSFTIDRKSSVFRGRGFSTNLNSWTAEEPLLGHAV